MSADRVVRVCARTSAPITEVWRLLADPFSYATWVSGTSRVRAADPRWPAVGARLYHRFGPWPLRIGDHTTVLECDPPHRIALAAGARPFGLVRAELTLTPAGSGSRVVLCEQLISGLGARWPALGHLVQRLRNRRSLMRLVRLAEHGQG